MVICCSMKTINISLLFSLFLLQSINSLPRFLFYLFKISIINQLKESLFWFTELYGVHHLIAKGEGKIILHIWRVKKQLRIQYQSPSQNWYRLNHFLGTPCILERDMNYRPLVKVSYTCRPTWWISQNHGNKTRLTSVKTDAVRAG